MSKTQVILNPHAASGRAGRLWTQIEPVMQDRLGELVLAITQNPGEVMEHLKEAHSQNLRQIISIGGDGTNHALVNALANLTQENQMRVSLPYGTLPIGTGKDWARSRGIPFDFHKSIEWIATAKPRPTDIGQVTIEDMLGRREVYFLNIASAGLGGEVDARVNRIATRRPWTFLKATVETILTYQPKHMKILLDGEPWYDDRALLVVVANGTTFGHGMKIAPQASIYDGLFDVLVIDAASKIRTLSALRHVYSGTHLQQPEVHFKRAKTVEISSQDGEISLDLDGEYANGNHLTFQIRPGLLNLLT